MEETHASILLPLPGMTPMGSLACHGEALSQTDQNLCRSCLLSLKGVCFYFGDAGSSHSCELGAPKFEVMVFMSIDYSWNERIS